MCFVLLAWLSGTYISAVNNQPQICMFQICMFFIGTKLETEFLHLQGAWLQRLTITLSDFVKCYALVFCEEANPVVIS